MKSNNILKKGLSAVFLAFVAILSPLAAKAEKANVFLFMVRM